ncbi:MAG: tetratricopeptide repeat protein [Alphaproteobacteria bacterium]
MTVLKRLVAAVAALVVLSGTTTAQEACGPLNVSQGVIAYNAGDYETALALLRPCAEQGYAIAQSNLGYMYDNGYGVAQDYTNAVFWYGLAAAQGDTFAQYSLGLYYGGGGGVPQDNVLAYMWLSIAAANGQAGADQDRGFVAGFMTADQIAEAERLAVDWLESHQP